jgi:hypothetical protein
MFGSACACTSCSASMAWVAVQKKDSSSNPMARGLMPGVKMVRIFSDRIRDRIRLEGFRSVHIRVRIFNIRYRIRIQILKSHIYDVDIQSYLIRHSWHYPYSNPNPDRNIKTNMISVLSVCIRSVFISTWCEEEITTTMTCLHDCRILQLRIYF